MKRIIIVVVSVLIVIAGGVWFFTTQNKPEPTPKSSLTVTYKTSLPAIISLYQAAYDGTPHPTQSVGTSIATLKNNVKTELDPGSYIISVEGKGVEPQSVGVIVGQNPVTKKLDISLPQTDLDILRQQEQPLVRSALVAKYPTILNLYTLNTGKLYGEGDWYGATLTYKGKNASQRDSLRFIAHKTDGEWTLVTPPLINIDVVSYPDIPRYIISSVDQPVNLPSIGGSPGAKVQ